MGLFDWLFDRRAGKETGDESTLSSGKARVSSDGYPICPVCGKKSAASVAQLRAEFESKRGEGYEEHVVGCIGCGKFFNL